MGSATVTIVTTHSSVIGTSVFSVYAASSVTPDIVAKASATISSGYQVSVVSSSAASSSGAAYTTSAATVDSSPTTLTVYATSVETIYSCAASVTNCPLRSSAFGSATVPVVTTHSTVIGTSVVALSAASSATPAIVSKAPFTIPSVYEVQVAGSTTAASSSEAVSATTTALMSVAAVDSEYLSTVASFSMFGADKIASFFEVDDQGAVEEDIYLSGDSENEVEEDEEGRKVRSVQHAHEDPKPRRRARMRDGKYFEWADDGCKYELPDGYVMPADLNFSSAQNEVAST